ncbi:transketolase [Desulfovibrio sp.]|uniref:transketolase n=1 Tax=Desulfovibrio sp. TaxID=885 RepID=UPI003FF01C22
MNTRKMRLDILKMALAAKSKGAHTGGSLSIVEIMAALYGGIMDMDAIATGKEERDRLILSKGHGAMAQYAALHQAGLIDDEELLTYAASNSRLSIHLAANPALGIDYASGSLGIGLSLGVGTALALRRKNNNRSRVFVILGDGECNEGAVWEAAASAAHYALGNLVAIVDRNGLQYGGDTESIMRLENFEARWQAFGWETVSVDGHDVAALEQALSLRTAKPLAIIARTIKGKGISFMENMPKWHHDVVTQKLFDQAVAELVEAEA